MFEVVEKVAILMVTIYFLVITLEGEGLRKSIERIEK